MALFGKSKKTDQQPAPKAVAEVNAAKKEKTSSLPNARIYNVIRKPRITEKATEVSERNIYTFDVAPNATKPEITQAIEFFFKVKPLAVRTVQVPAKKVTRRGRVGKTAARKKAYVELKKGDSIELV
jgi:large subunit ribosomal protein L23